MKRVKLFALISLLFIGLGHAWGAEDVLNLAFTGVTTNTTTYTDFKDKVGTSGAVYAGNCAGGNASIQLRTKNSNSGIVTTSSGGKAKTITIKWNSNTTSGRTLDVYGKNTAYSSAADLYSTEANTSGTKLGSIVYGTSTSLTIDGDYAYIGLRSNSDAMYIESITIAWESGSSGGVTYTDVFMRSRGSRCGGWHNGSTAPCSAFCFTFHCMSKNTRASRSSAKAPLFGSLMVHIVLTDTKKQ